MSALSSIPHFFFVVLVLGTFFAFFSLLVRNDLKLPQIFALAGVWTLFEWSRLFFLSGFAFDPIGLNLTATLWGLQGAALFGVFGLTFWILATNLALLQRRWVLWGLFAALPYAYGLYHVTLHSLRQGEEKISALIVQTALYPEEKMPLGIGDKPPLSVAQQWERIGALLTKHEGKKVDYVLLPEAVVPYGIHYPGNAAYAQEIANHFNTEAIVCLEDFDGKSATNSAFHFLPHGGRPERYDKRILVPFGEYIPFEWSKKILARYGIQDSYRAGERARVFAGKIPFAVSICYEEMFGHLMRESVVGGAQLLMNMTNDAWYPASRLPVVHYLHGRVRTVEGGVPLLRATNTGVTCGIDSLGRLCGSLPYETRKAKAPAECLFVEVPAYHYPTLYTLWGDWGICSLSFFCIVVPLLRKKSLSFIFSR